MPSVMDATSFFHKDQVEMCFSSFSLYFDVICLLLICQNLSVLKQHSASSVAVVYIHVCVMADVHVVTCTPRH